MKRFFKIGLYVFLALALAVGGGLVGGGDVGVEIPVGGVAQGDEGLVTGVGQGEEAVGALLKRRGL